MFGRKPKQLVGLDIGSSAVKVVQVRASGDRVELLAAGVEPIPAETIVNGAIADAGAVSDAVRRLLERHKITQRSVAVSLSGRSVIVKRIELPAMSRQELDATIQWEAQQHIPFDIRDVSLDFQVVRGADGEGARQASEVLLVAAKRDQVEDYVSIVTQAGCVPVVVDVDAFALQNAYELNHGIDHEQLIVLVHAGASVVNTNIVRGDESIFMRDLSIGGNAYTEALQKELHLAFDPAEQLKKGVPVDGVTYEDAEPVLHAVTENVVLELAKTFDFFRTTADSDPFDKIVLSGGTSRIEGLGEALAERFDTPVERFDPFRRVSADPARLPDEQREALTAIAPVALGLALRHDR